MVLTTTSFAISPASRETEDCQFPNPKGLNIGVNAFPIYARKLLLISVNPEKLKFDNIQTNMDIDKIIVPAFFINPFPLSQVCNNKFLGSGSLYSGSSIIKVLHLF